MAITIAQFYLICAIFYVIFKILERHVRRKRLYELASKFPGPLTLPFIGNGHLFLGTREQFLNRMQTLTYTYPSPSQIWFGPHLYLFMSDPEQLEEVCLSSKTLAKGIVYNSFAPFLGTGLFTAPVPKWRVNRKLIQPTFNTKILESFVEIFVAQSQILTEKFSRISGGPEFEIFDLVSSCTLDMICETAMGIKIGSQTNEKCLYIDAVMEVVHSISERLFKFWLFPDFIFYRTNLGKKQKKNIKYLHDFAYNVIRKKRNEFLTRNNSQGNNDDEEKSDDSKYRREAFLDHLIKLANVNGSFTDENLREEIDTFVAGATDSIARTSTFCILMLASHPDIQEKVYEELYEIYGNSEIEERPVAPKDLSKMKCLERVIKETLRLFPVAPFITRSVTEDLKIGENTLPRGSTVFMAILSVHRNEKYWPNPLKFDPDRFLPEENAKRHPYSFMGFSNGPRNCIGQNFSMMAMKTLFATVLRKYIFIKDNIVPIKDIRLTFDFILHSVDPIKVRIGKRTRHQVPL